MFQVEAGLMKQFVVN